MCATLFAAACDPETGGTGSPGTGSKSSSNARPPAAAGDGATAAASLKSLKVAEPQPMTGYSRDRFPHWKKAGSNCDTRDTVLARDGKNIKLDGCNVTGGSWHSVYDGLNTTDPLKVDIDHMVPLAAAWRAGADSWTDDKRSDFANDLTRPQLFAVSSTSNRSKGDQDPSTWKPPSRDFWCTYAVDWITVKTYWKLTVTTAEKAALTDMLETCV
ncbi:HNH endonuclease family protein [Catellatospora sp. TT07R-123]|uniref:HNH endonuclease family protein n=1 Tax=Catellatospora sp. TT07R-123 TaxID=2733863 RepID=UPI001FD16FD3|nr:HNH endonuclease family protein [Catellatospora sp. TT07R-123]